MVDFRHLREFMEKGIVWKIGYKNQSSCERVMTKSALDFLGLIRLRNLNSSSCSTPSSESWEKLSVPTSETSEFSVWVPEF